MTCSTSQLVTGDNTDVVITLQSSAGAAVNVSTATEIKARLVRYDRLAALTPVYTCSSGASGANWATGVVVVSVLGTDTASLDTQDGAWEVQVVTASSKTTYLDVGIAKVIKGWV
jgi:hypothetical protein